MNKITRTAIIEHTATGERRLLVINLTHSRAKGLGDDEAAMRMIAIRNPQHSFIGYADNAQSR